MLQRAGKMDTCSGDPIIHRFIVVFYPIVVVTISLFILAPRFVFVDLPLLYKTNCFLHEDRINNLISLRFILPNPPA